MPGSADALTKLHSRLVVIFNQAIGGSIHCSRQQCRESHLDIIQSYLNHFAMICKVFSWRQQANGDVF